MLAHLVKTKLSTSGVSAIIVGEDRVSLHTPEIMDRFQDYYADLYSSRQEKMREEMDNFFRKLIIPPLSEIDRMELDKSITLEEIQLMVKDGRTKISQGQMASRLRLTNILVRSCFREFMSVLNWSTIKGELPSSMME